LDGIKRKDRKTPNYILAEETKIKEIRMRAVRRAIRYEGKARYSKKKIVCECIKELEKRRPAEEEGKWEKRRELVEKAEISNAEQLKKGIEVDAQETLKGIMEKVEKKEKSERQRKINESKYNETIKTEEF